MPAIEDLGFSRNNRRDVIPVDIQQQIVEVGQVLSDNTIPRNSTNNNKTFRQDNAPVSGMLDGDIWYDTNDNNKPYRYTSGAWITTRDTGAVDSYLVGWTQTLVYSATDENTVAWTSGSIILGNGVTYTIDAGNTGNISALTYIYLSIATSTTVLQTTTTASSAVGTGKLLVAVAKNVTAPKLCEFAAFNGNGQGVLITANNIVANSITANELATTLLYAGAITIDTNGLIKSGMTDYLTGSGWWMGDVSGVKKFSIGNSSGYYMAWDGSQLLINAITNQEPTFTGRNNDGLTESTFNGTITRSLIGTSMDIVLASSGDVKLMSVGLGLGNFDSYFEFVSGSQVTGTGNSGASWIHFIGICNGTTTPTSTSLTTRHIGFFIKRTSGNAYELYASNANGTTQTISSDISAGITFTNNNKYRILKNSTGILFYVNNTLVATNTTNLPSADDARLLHSMYTLGGSGTASVAINNNYSIKLNS
jgi:hypothetical protein